MGIRQDLEKQGYKVDWNPSGVIRVTDPKTGKSADLLPGSYYVDKNGTAQWYGNTQQQIQKALSSSVPQQNQYINNVSNSSPSSTSNAKVSSTPVTATATNPNQYLYDTGTYVRNDSSNNNVNNAYLSPQTVDNVTTVVPQSITPYDSIIQAQQQQIQQLQQQLQQIQQSLQNTATNPLDIARMAAMYLYSSNSNPTTTVNVPSGTEESTTTTPKAPEQLSTLGATVSLGVPLVSVMPTVDDVYNLYKQYNNGQDNAQAQAFFASPDFQQVLQGNIPTWMLTDPGWAAFLQKLFQLYNPQADANTLALFNKLLTSVQ